MISEFLIHGKRKHRTGCTRSLPLFPKINQIDLWRGHLISNIPIDVTARSDSLRSIGLISSKKLVSKNTLQSSELSMISQHSSLSKGKEIISSTSDSYSHPGHNSSAQNDEPILVLQRIIHSTRLFTDTTRLDQIRHHYLLSNTLSLRSTVRMRHIFINSQDSVIRESSYEIHHR